MNKTIFIAAMLAVATVLAAGLTILPASVQEAQANPCALEVEQDYEVENGDGGTGSSTDIVTSDDNRECTFIGGEFDFDED
jgi:hypothetical protein